MPALMKVIDARAVSSPTLDRASFSRLEFWAEILGDRELVTITPEEVDDALVKLAERGRLSPRRGKPTAGAGQPYKGSTLNRYLSTLGTVYKYARRLRLISRGYVSATRGIERAPEPADPDRYLRPAEVECLLAVARVVDGRWGKLPALITLAFHIGLRVGNLTLHEPLHVDEEVRSVCLVHVVVVPRV